ncbi:MAG: RNA polymerase sigma factor [Phycisphaerae bacterium]
MHRSPEDIEDELLVLRCQGGEPEAFNALVSRWQPRLQRLAKRLTADRDAASDLVQDAWLAIVRGLRRLDDPARFRAWAYRIVTNKCADWIRRRAVRRDAALAFRVAVSDPNDDSGRPTFDEADEITRMRAMLRQLPDVQRTILSLHYLDGLSVLEIATVFNLPTGTVKSRLHNARVRLRRTLQETNHE